MTSSDEFHISDSVSWNRAEDRSIVKCEKEHLLVYQFL